MTANVIVMASDGSALADRGTQLEPMLRRYTVLIEDQTGLHVRVLPLDADLHAEIHDLGGDAGALFLPHVRPEVAHAARTVSLPVLTSADTTAIALTAAVSNTLSRAGRKPAVGRVVIVGADAVPVLCPLLMVAGIGEITVWNPNDAIAFPLRRITAGVDVVVDLRTTAAGVEALVPEVQPVVITPDIARDPLLALPGLLGALARVPGSRMDVQVHHACALALVMATRPDGPLPAQPDRTLTVRVADAATRTLLELTRRPSDTTFG